MVVLRDTTPAIPYNRDFATGQDSQFQFPFPLVILLAQDGSTLAQWFADYWFYGLLMIVLILVVQAFRPRADRLTRKKSAVIDPEKNVRGEFKKSSRFVKSSTDSQQKLLTYEADEMGSDKPKRKSKSPDLDDDLLEGPPSDDVSPTVQMTDSALDFDFDDSDPELDIDLEPDQDDSSLDPVVIEGQPNKVETRSPTSDRPDVKPQVSSKMDLDFELDSGEYSELDLRLQDSDADLDLDADDSLPPENPPVVVHSDPATETRHEAIQPRDPAEAEQAVEPKPSLMKRVFGFLGGKKDAAEVANSAGAIAAEPSSFSQVADLATTPKNQPDSPPNQQTDAKPVDGFQDEESTTISVESSSATINVHDDEFDFDEDFDEEFEPDGDELNDKEFEPGGGLETREETDQTALPKVAVAEANADRPAADFQEASELGLDLAKSSDGPELMLANTPSESGLPVAAPVLFDPEAAGDQKQLETLEMRVAELSAEKKSLEEDLAAANQALNQLESESQEYQAQAKASVAELETVRAEQTTMSTQVKALESQLTEQAGQLETANATLSEAEAKVKALEDRLAVEQQQVASANESRTAIEETSKQQAEEVEQERAAREAAETERDQLKSELESELLARKDVESIRSELTSQLETEREVRQQLETERDELIAQVESAQTLRQSAESSLEALEDKLAAEQKLRAAAEQARDNALESARQAAEQPAEHLDVEVKQTMQENAAPNEDVEELTVRFKKRLKQEYRKRKQAQKFLDEAEHQRAEVAKTLKAVRQELMELKEKGEG